MRVHDPRRDDHVAGVDLLRATAAVEAGERRDPAVPHADVDAPARQARAVDDEAASDDEVVFAVAHRAHEPAAANVAAPCRTTRNDSPSGPATKP